jgi:hypothetical protein
MPIDIADTIRRALHAQVCAHLGSDVAFNGIRESTLVKNGAYCGRRFSLMGYSLVWFQEERHVKLFDPNGALVLSCALTQFCNLAHREPSDHRQAA